jgi:hypothetical protein
MADAPYIPPVNREVSIQLLTTGCVVRIAWQDFAFQSLPAALSAIERYAENPQEALTEMFLGAEHKWLLPSDPATTTTKVTLPVF